MFSEGVGVLNSRDLYRIGAYSDQIMLDISAAAPSNPMEFTCCIHGCLDVSPPDTLFLVPGTTLIRGRLPIDGSKRLQGD